MKLRRLLAFGLVFLAACTSDVVGSGDPQGPEVLNISQGNFLLAPGRDAWLSAATFIRTDSSHLTAVIRKVSFESTDLSVASVSLDSVGLGHIVAHKPGTATIKVVSQRQSDVTRWATVRVVDAPAANDTGLVYSALATVRPTSGNFGDQTLGPTQLDARVIISNPTPPVDARCLARRVRGVASHLQDRGHVGRCGCRRSAVPAVHGAVRPSRDRARPRGHGAGARLSRHQRGHPRQRTLLRRGHPGVFYGCAAYLALGIIQPGETLLPREYNVQFPVVDMLADSLPVAHYYFSAKLGMNGRSVLVPAGDADVRR